MIPISVSAESFKAIFANDQRAIVWGPSMSEQEPKAGDTLDLVSVSGAHCRRVVTHRDDQLAAVNLANLVYSLRPLTTAEKDAIK